MLHLIKQRHITKPNPVNIFIAMPDDNRYFKDDGFVKSRKINNFQTSS